MRTRLFLATFGCAAAPAFAANFIVTNTAQDLPDEAPGNGVCKVAGSTACTLRAAVMESNALAGADIIVVPTNAHITLTITGRNEDAAATGDLDISAPLTISTFGEADPAERPIIDADGIDRVFDIRPNAGDVSIRYAQIINGAATDATTFVGGGVRQESGSLLNLDYCDIRGNAANAGGGVYTNGNLQFFLSELHGNVVTALGFTNPHGSAIKDSDSGPVQPLDGVTLKLTTVYANLALGTGAGAAVDVRRQILVENATISGNQPNGLQVFAANATLNLATIAGNQVGYLYAGTSLTQSSEVRNSIIANNTVADCQFGGSASYSHSYTLASDTSCNLGFGTGNLPSTDPRLKPLAIRYGTTRVHDLLPGSPAIDHAGSGSTCPSRDQDDIPRPLDGDGVDGARCDMGSVEFVDAIFANGFQLPPAATLHLTQAGPGPTVVGDVVRRWA